MNKNKMPTLKEKIKKTCIYKLLIRCYLSLRRLRNEHFQYRQLLREAEHRFAQEHPIHGSISDYRHCYHKYHVSYSEYMYQYEFWKLTEEQRKEFVSRWDMQMIYHHGFVSQEIANVLTNKKLFLQRYSNYILRSWMLVKDHSFEEVQKFIQSHDCIAKPLDSSCGRGIFLIKANEQLSNQTYHKYVDNNILLEECITALPEISQFNPDSLNTIRVTTFSNGEEVVVFASFIRFGRKGKCIDNAHAGGIFAQINIQTGMIESNGINTEGEEFEYHPDSHLPFKGFTIPKWEDIKQLCCNATLADANMRVCG